MMRAGGSYWVSQNKKVNLTLYDLSKSRACSGKGFANKGMANEEIHFQGGLLVGFAN